MGGLEALLLLSAACSVALIVALPVAIVVVAVALRVVTDVALDLADAAPKHVVRQCPGIGAFLAWSPWRHGVLLYPQDAMLTFNVGHVVMPGH